ncbi:hypothetical protein [Sphingomonas sp. 28-62-11]|uniref:hypothetical protein n=1 Tax=Sphingomonas sp. 28-62-11 TaxID=1970432 RepID=UPI000BC52022|nr:MAG: hypothetical protein B7Y49_09000 [Sphingomonas sp. 28-62-11]
MPGQMPPPRYRIVERNRRLVVIDNWATVPRPLVAQSPITRPDRQISAPTPPAKLQKIAFDGRTSFTTHRLFDARGPRTIILDPGSASAINGVKIGGAVAAFALVVLAFISPVLLLPLVVLLQRRVREQIRSAITAWLDRAALNSA